MKYTNGYTLIKELVRRYLLNGFRNEIGWNKDGCKGIFTVFDIRFDEPEFLNDWIKLTLQDYLNKHAIFYLEWYGVFSIDANEDVSLGIDCIEDLRESNPDLNVLEDILQILIKELSLDKYDNGEHLEYQYLLEFVLDFEDIDKRIYNNNVFLLRSLHNDPNIKTEVNTAIDLQIERIGLQNIQENLIDYFVNIHNSNEDLPYSSIFLSIDSEDSGEISTVRQFVGTEFQTPENFREYLENISIDFELDLDEIEKNTFGFLNA